MKTTTYFLSYLAEFFLELEMFQTKISQKIKTYILCSVYFFFSENRAVYEIIWKTIVEPDRPQMTIWRMRISFWIPNATNIHSEYVILIDFYCNNGCTNSPQRYFIRTLFVLFIIFPKCALLQNVMSLYSFADHIIIGLRSFCQIY